MGVGLPKRKTQNQLLLSLEEYPLRISNLGEQMGEVVQFIPKRDLERARLIQEARAIYERIFPTEGPASLQRVPTNQ
jgi:hypothetical protein